MVNPLFHWLQILYGNRFQVRLRGLSGFWVIGLWIPLRGLSGVWVTPGFIISAPLQFPLFCNMELVPSWLLASLFRRKSPSNKLHVYYLTANLLFLPHPLYIVLWWCPSFSHCFLDGRPYYLSPCDDYPSLLLALDV